MKKVLFLRLMKTHINLFVFLVLGLFSLASCQRDSNTMITSGLQIELVDSIKYGFTENMSYHKGYVQYIPGDSIDIMSFLEDRTNTIFLFNAETGEPCDSIKLDFEGSKGVGKIQGYFYLNRDTIITYQYGSGRCMLANWNSEILHTYELFDAKERQKDTTHLFQSPFIETLSPMLLVNKEVVFPTGIMFETSMERESNTTVTMLCDLMTGSISHHNPYPETYRKHNWGGGFFYRTVHMCRGLDANSVVLSFPADERLWEFNLSTHTLTAHEGACQSVSSIKPFKETKELISDNPENAVEDWYYSQDNYEGVFSDPYRNLYYRIGRLAVEETPSGFNNKGVVIAAYDRDFSYLGETVLPANEEYDTFNAYVSRKGLNIHLWRPADEDHWTYYTYALK